MRLNFEQSLINVDTYCKEHQEISKIIKNCNLWMLQWSWKNWKDSGGNLLLIKKSNKFQIQIKSENYIDLYLKRHPSYLYNMASQIIVGSSESGENVVFWFLCKDGWRYSIFYKGIWQGNFPPLLSGISALQVISISEPSEDPIYLGEFKLLQPDINIKMWLGLEHSVDDNWPEAIELNNDNFALSWLSLTIER